MRRFRGLIINHESEKVKWFLYFRLSTLSFIYHHSTASSNSFWVISFVHNAPSYITKFESKPSFISLRFLQSSKAPTVSNHRSRKCPICFTLSGISIDLRLSHPQNAPCSIDLNRHSAELFPLKLLQFQMQKPGFSSTLPGSFIVFRFIQSLNV